jgi:hypothetical protein
MKGEKKSRLLNNEYNVFKKYLLDEVIFK